MPTTRETSLLEGGLVSGFPLMTDSEDNRRLAVKTIERHISAIAKGDQPLAELWLHVLNRATNTGLIAQNLHSLPNRLGRTARGIGVLVGKEPIQPFDIPQCRGRPNQL